MNDTLNSPVHIVQEYLITYIASSLMIIIDIRVHALKYSQIRSFSWYCVEITAPFLVNHTESDKY